MDSGKLEKLPLEVLAGWLVVMGVRVNLENSTACQKSMPIPRLGWLCLVLRCVGLGVIGRMNFFPLVDNE